MKSVFALGASFAAAALLAALAPACSSSSSSTPAPNPDVPDPLVTACDATKCAPGNQCLTVDGETKCRKACSSNDDPTSNCPANYVCEVTNQPSTIPASCVKVGVAQSRALCSAATTTFGTRLNAYTCGDDAKPSGCVAVDGAYCCNDAPPDPIGPATCAKMFNPVVTPGPKQWGAACNPTKGVDNNEDCDFAQGFLCKASSPTDATAYCTRYGCTGDRECAGGFTCGTINTAPNAAKTARSYHTTEKACLRREYGSACTVGTFGDELLHDIDCPPIAGRPMHCVGDDLYRGFCTTECANSQNCNYDAKCLAPGDDHVTAVCYPRAGVIVGDGSFCSPCRSDADCGADGACVKGEYTQERFCAKPSVKPCTASSVKCPTSAKPGVSVGCNVPVANKPKPLDNYCYGLYEFSDGNDLGCWTIPR